MTPPLLPRIDAFLAVMATPANMARDIHGSLQHAIAKTDEDHLLQKAFNRVARKSSDRHQRPALLLQAEFGLTDIGCDYKMPEGIAHKKIEAYVLCLMWAYRQEQLPAAVFGPAMHELLDRMEDLNPELKRLRYDRTDARRLFDAAMGVTSGFNIDDMQFFLDGNYGYIAEKNPQWVAKHETVKRLLGIMGPGWVASEPTLDKIAAQARAKRDAAFKR